jgi:predicted O-linked N-acetylglucosamine transferase (SPINDLY family)
MAIALPRPPAPGPSGAHARAHRRWQAGQALVRRQRWIEAAQAFEQAATICDHSAYALAAIHSLIEAGRPVDAVRRARAVRAAEPRLALACTLESHALLGLGQPEAAVDTLCALPADVPRDHDYQVSLAVSLQRAGRYREAVKAFLDALALKMDDALSHYRLGMCFKELAMKAEAAECVRTAVLLGLGSSDLAARGQLVFLEREACHWAAADEAMAGLRAAVRASPADEAVETSPFPHAVFIDDPLEILKVARHYALHALARSQPLPRRAAKAREGRLRIGYLSADFHQHATSQLIAQMLECHDRTAFEVTLLSTGPDDKSPLRQRIVASSERFVELRGLGAGAIAARVRDLGIDILVDLKGATYDTVMPVMAHRPAPLQVSWLGFPGSSGAPYIDYLIGDRIVSPLEHVGHFSEKIAQLPGCYQPNDGLRPMPLSSRRSDWGLADDALVLCAFHQPYKISAEVFDRWCGLLHELPGAVLWLLQWNVNVEATLTAAARARGIGPERIVFAPLLATQAHLSRLASADLFLDAWPCNGHTTVGEALWVGLPVVTMIGPTFAQRVAASLLHAVALDELVCSDAAGYVDLAVALANDPGRRAALRTHLATRRTACGLFDGAAFARDIEALYRRMWERSLAGMRPEHLMPVAGTCAVPTELEVARAACG